MGYIIINGKVQEAKKVTLTSYARTILQTETQKQKEIKARILKRKKFYEAQRSTSICTTA